MGPPAPAGASLPLEPIAIIGLGCRLPEAPDPLAYWDLVANGVDAVRDVPDHRWDVDALFDPDPTKPGKIMSKRGGYLDDVDGIDWRAFRISPREAKFMDPQHRLLLEVAWEAIDDAGIPFDRLAGSSTAVVIGIMWNDYAKLQAHAYSKLEGYNANGNSFAYAANRISYFFDLKGPSFAIDVQCASSLASVHLACQSLRDGEAEVALAGGVNLILSPDTNIAMSKAAILSPDGRCKTWDATADGFVRGEGAGIVVLKPLSAAQADSDRIYAVLRATAVSHGGKTDWIMAPSREGQEHLLRLAYQRAGIDPATVDYVEIHGTGTKVGDPIEAAALGAVVGASGRADRCRVGSVKTNIGHLDSAAGVAGLIKTALAVHHRQIPPSLHFRNVNPAISLTDLKLAVQTELEPWPERNEVPVAGVTALSFGGGHAHAVLTGVPAAPARGGAPPSRPFLMPISAKNDDALRLLARAYRDFLGPGGRGEALSLVDVCHTAAVRRTHHDHRAAIVASNRGQLLDRLDALARGENRPGLSVGRRTEAAARPVFVFSGQGKPWWSSGRELLALEPAFRRAVAACDQRMRVDARWSLLDELTRSEQASRLDRTAFAQPATFALQMGLAALWRSWGVEPALVIGHSVGEVAAAAVAGALEPADAARLVVRRARVMADAPSHPALAAVMLPRPQVEAMIEPYGNRMAVAADNAPTTVVVSGPPDLLAQLVRQCAERDVYATILPANDVFHRAPEAFGPRLASALGDVRPFASGVTFVSTVTGGFYDGAALDAAYWGRQLSVPVRLREAVEAALDAGHHTFIELAAHSVLTGAVTNCLHGRSTAGVVVSSLRRGEPEQWTMLDALGRLYTAGHAVSWDAVEAAPGQSVSLPNYPWQRERVWVDVEQPVDTGASSVVVAARGGHPLLGAPTELAATGLHIWETVLDVRQPRHLGEHRVQGVAVLAGAGYVEMVAVAAAESFGWEQCTLSDVELGRALVLPDKGNRRVQLVMEEAGRDEARFRVYSRTAGAAGGWSLHVSGLVAAGAQPSAETATPLDVEQVGAALPDELTGSECYRRFVEMGEQYGPTYQGIARLRRREGQVLAEMRAPSEIITELPRYRFHPALLDACMHALVMGGPESGAGGFMPTRIDRIRALGRLDARAWSHVHLRAGADDQAGEQNADIRIVDQTGVSVMEIEGLRLQYLDEAALRAPLEERWYYELAWRQVGIPPGAAAAPPETEGCGWLVLADRAGTGEALAELLIADGDEVVLARPGPRQVVSRGRLELEPDSPDAMRWALDQAAADGRPPLAGIVHLWSLDAPAVDDATVDEVGWAQVLGCGAALHAVHALAGQGAKSPGRLTLVTRGAQAVGGEPSVAALQAALWGFGRSLAQERPELWGGLVDLDTGADAAAAAAALRAELRADDGEDQCAWRDGLRHVARLAPKRVPPTDAPLRWRADGAYLVTGGLGDLGLVVARWLAEQGARRLVLLGRTPLPPRTEWAELDDSSDPLAAARVAAIRQIEWLGAAVHVASVDVGDQAQLTAFLDGYAREGWPPIRGVVHAAGVAPFEAIEQMTLDSVRGVLRPKVEGGWLLDRLLRSDDLELLVLFSSASGVLSSPRLAHYAAGNAFLDALAHHRRARGRTALSINWGPWADVGMATRTGTGGPASLRGIQLIALDAGLDAMSRLLATEETQVAVLPVEWGEWRESYRSASEAPILSEVMAEAIGDGAVDLDVVEAIPAGGLALDLLLAAPPAEVPERVAELVADQVGAVLRVPAGALAGQPLAELGFDSLMAIELRSRLSRGIGMDVSILDILEASTVELLSDLLVTRLTEMAASSPYRPSSRPDHAAGVLGRVTDIGPADGDRHLAAYVEWVVGLLQDDEIELVLAELEAAAPGGRR